MENLGQSLWAAQADISLMKAELKQSKRKISLLVGISMLSLIMSGIIVSGLTLLYFKGTFNPNPIVDVIDDSLEAYAVKDNDVSDLEDIKGKLVHAGRFDEIPDDTKYDRWGLPVDRKWLTSSEWQGKHLSGGSVEKSMFKTWKSIHMNSFIKYVKDAAAEEVKVKKYSIIPKELYSAQSILESAFGVSRLAIDANNLYGHKCYDCTDPEDYVEAHDDDPDDRFHVKKDKWESIRSHSKLLMRKYYPRIPEHRRANPDIKDWLDALCGCGRELSVKKAKKAHDAGKFSYATSCYKGKKGYAKKIMGIIKLYKLDE